jgi:hypothetical protein
MRDGVRQPFKLLNVALCAQPAMHDPAALIAASRSVTDLRTVKERATSYVMVSRAVSKAAKILKGKHGS